MSKWIARIGLATIVILLAACGGAGPAPTETVAPATPTAPAATATVEALTPSPAGALSTGPLPDVPRNRTLELAWGIGSPLGVTNPFNTGGYTEEEGNNLLWEGLAYYAIFADKEIPWLAQSMTYNGDYTELTIKLNPLARWSDGQPVTAQDVLFTFQSEINNDQLVYHQPFQESVQAVQATDSLTVVVTFKKPAPRFKFEILTLKFDIGLPIAPAHALSQQAALNDFEGGLDLPHSGPYNLVYWDADRKIYDLRPDWWAVPAGLMPMPAARRVVIENSSNLTVDQLRTRLVNNDYDATADWRPAAIASVLKQDSKLTTFTGNSPPYGNLDWWPNALFFNTQQAPYNDVRVRRALSLAIDRAQIDATIYEGAPVATIYPFPLYPGLQSFADSPEVKALEAKYQPGKFDLAESGQLMTDAGFTKNVDGLWVKDGQTVNATVNGFDALDGDIAPLLGEMLKAGGFDATVNFGPDAYNNMLDGKQGLYLWGHGGSLIDPFLTFELFNGRYSRPNGTATDAEHLSRYKNPAFDQLVDAMSALPANDPRFHALAVQAMEIYWRDVIDIPVVQWLHRIPYNQTYWTNWPTKDNAAMGINGAFWHNTGMLLVASLKPAQ